MMRLASVLVRSIVLALIALPVAADDAKTRFGPGLKDFKNYTGPKLVGEQLRACVALDLEFREVERRHTQSEQNITVAERARDRATERVDSLHATLDTSDGDSVDAYNDAIHRESALVKEYNAQLPAFNALVEQYNALGDRFNASCAGRAYLIRDWIAIEGSSPN
jgi:hypothetical protein